MAARATWKGYLKLSLVSCPVRLFPATTRGRKVSFHWLHKDTNNRIQMKAHDPEMGEVDRADLVKGYEYEKDHYVILTDEDFETVRIESTETMTIERFVDAAAVDRRYLDSPYYVAPDGAVAEEAFRVIQRAMVNNNKAALSRVVLSAREHLILLTALGKGLVATTLRSADEVRSEQPYFEDILDEEPDRELLTLAEQLIAQRSGAFDPAEFRDRYQDALLELVKAKIRGEQPVVAEAPERGKVINLMDALKRSIQEQERKPPAPSRRKAPERKQAEAQPAARRRGGRKSSG